MKDILIKSLYNLELKTIIDLLKKADNDFSPKLSERTDIGDYALKLKNNANFIIASSPDNKQIYGFSAFYCNDPLKINAYITLIWVDKEYRGMGIFKKLLKKTIFYVKRQGFFKICLEVTYESIQYFEYRKIGFKDVANEINITLNNIKKIKMEKYFNVNK